MIPVSLIIKGLYSYQEPQKIEFNRLIEGQLFGIFGSVGSGKSSILEAISFALYGETERLNKSDNRNYNMMNLKSDELLIDFIFKNFDNINYRFMVRGKRHGKDFNKVNTYTRSAYKEVEGEWIPLESASAEPILGLSYNNFRRTIIIPQGKFQEFLQLGDTDRTRMLKEIFQLNKYEFYNQTINLEQRNNAILQNLTGQLLHYKEVTQEIILIKELEVQQLSDTFNEQKKQFKEKETLHRAQQSLKKLFDDRAACQLKLNGLLREEEEIKQLDKKVHDYEYCLFHFKDKLDRKKEIEASLIKRKESLQELSESLTVCCADLGLLEKESEVVQLEHAKQDKYKELIADYELILYLIGLKADIEKLKKRIEEGQVYVDKAATDKLKAQNKLADLKEKLIVLKSALPDMVVLVKLRTWFDKKGRFNDTIEEYGNKLKELAKSEREVSQAIKQQLSDSLLQEVGEGSPPHYHSSEVRALRIKFREQQEEVQNQINHHRLQMKLGEFAMQLESGEPCMLCGSNHHPQVLKVDDVQSQLDKAYQEIEVLKAYDSSLEKILHDLSQFIHQEQSILQQKKDFQQQLDKEISGSLLHDQDFIWTDFSARDPAMVETAFKIAEQTQRELADVEREINITEGIVQQKTADHEKYGQAVNELIFKLKGKEAEYSTLERQLQNMSFEENSHLIEADVKPKIEALYQTIQVVKRRFEELSEQSKELKDKKIVLIERIASTNQYLLENSNLLKKIEDDLAACLAKSSYADFNDIQYILKESFDIAGLKKQVSAYHQQLFSVKQQLNQLEDLLGGQVFEVLEFNALEESLVHLKRDLDELNSSFIREQAVLLKTKEDLNKKLQLEKQLEKLQHRATYLNTLKQLFKGSGFVSYISTVYLQNLCHAANKRFYKLTRQQLRLEVTDKNEFQVRDFLNNGKVRNVKTLSGGQTFQASLSLALALAESVQQQNKSNQNFFFLDEGFGSLDKESLQIAFDTLKSLRKENRIVGIISHVEELQQEIDIFLNVVNDPFSGSKVAGNWK